MSSEKRWYLGKVLYDICIVTVIIINRHENISGYYRVSAYLLAKVLCDIIPLRVIPTVAFGIITYWMIGTYVCLLKPLCHDLTSIEDEKLLAYAYRISRYKIFKVWSSWSFLRINFRGWPSRQEMVTWTYFNFRGLRFCKAANLWCFPAWQASLA